jgi:hypothetical protein
MTPATHSEASVEELLVFAARCYWGEPKADCRAFHEGHVPYVTIVLSTGEHITSRWHDGKLSACGKDLCVCGAETATGGAWWEEDEEYGEVYAVGCRYCAVELEERAESARVDAAIDRAEATEAYR